MPGFCPDFLIAGAPRSGTGWMLSCLQEHPDAYVPPHEVNYFSYEYDRPADWYRDQFADAAPEQATGEKSPSYLAHPEAPARIHDWNPDVDLIFPSASRWSGRTPCTACCYRTPTTTSATTLNVS